MKKIRIGNDIIVRTKLSEFNTSDKLNIKQLRCLFIRKDVLTENDSKVKYYESSDYVYGLCGYPTYNCKPYNNGYNIPCTAIDAHWFPGYNGFGVISKKFECPLLNDYQSNVKIFDDYIEAYMPANDQVVGVYQVMFVASIYKPGWGTDNIKHATIDEGELFQIVDFNEAGVTKNGIIDLTLRTDPDQVIEHIIPTNDELYIYNNETYKLGDIDARDNVYNFTFKDDLTDDIYEVTEDNLKLFSFDIDIEDNTSILGLIDENGSFSVSTPDNDGYFYIIIKSKADESIFSKIRCHIYENINPVEIKPIDENLVAFPIGKVQLFDYCKYNKRYGFMYKTSPYGDYKYIDDSNVNLFKFELSRENIPTLLSTIDEDGSLNIKEEENSSGDFVVTVTSRKNENIKGYIKCSVSEVYDPNDISSHEPTLIINAINPIRIGTSLHLSSDISNVTYYIQLSDSNELWRSFYYDEHSFKRYLQATLSLANKSENNKCVINEDGSIYIDTDMNTDATISVWYKNKPSISAYVNVSIITQ